MGALAFPYPASIIGTTLAQPIFYTYLQLIEADDTISAKSHSLIRATSGVVSAGGAFGILGSTYISDLVASNHIASHQI
jgi:hypothetical protein